MSVEWVHTSSGGSARGSYGSGGGGGGGGGAGIISGGFRSIDFSSLPSMLDGWYPGKDNDMVYTNPQAAEIAKEILDEETKGALRETVAAAVKELRALVADTSCGSTLTFAKHNDKGQHFYYAVVKSGKHWYTTAAQPRVLESDEKLIEWLIGLEIYAAPRLALTAPPADDPTPIEATASEE